MWRHESLFYPKELSGGTHIPHPGFPHSGPSLSVWPEANSKIRAPTFPSRLIYSPPCPPHKYSPRSYSSNMSCTFLSAGPLLKLSALARSPSLLQPQCPWPRQDFPGLIRVSCLPFQLFCLHLGSGPYLSRPHNQASDRVSTNRCELPGQQT